MFCSSRPVIFLIGSAFALAACGSFENPTSPRPNGAATIGAVLGTILGAGSKEDNGIGLPVSGVIGQELDRQEATLRASMGSQNLVIANTGSELVLTLPAAVIFDTGSDIVRDALRGDLQALANNLNEFPNTTVDIIGHTDNVGQAGINQDLSARQAEAVSVLLRDSGVNANRLRAFGRGEGEPKASNLSEEGRAANRRLEIIIRPIS